MSTNSLLATHVHHWVVAEAIGPTSEGICKACGERRAFSNEPAKYGGALAGRGLSESSESQAA